MRGHRNPMRAAFSALGRVTGLVVCVMCLMGDSCESPTAPSKDTDGPRLKREVTGHALARRTSLPGNSWRVESALSP